MAENLGNDFSTTLNGSIDNVVTTVNVNSSTGSPAANFRIRVDDELMLVTSKGTGLNWTVTRNIESTTAVSHANAAPVAHVLTFGGLSQYLVENYAALVGGKVAASQLGTGTADARSFLRGDQTYARTWNLLVKATATSRASTTTLTADPDLQLAVAASTTYRARFTFQETHGAGAFKFRVTGPASPTLVHIHRASESPSSAYAGGFMMATAFDTSDFTYNADSNPSRWEVEVLLQNGANAGTLAISWAQSVSNGANTTMLAGSMMEWTQL